MNQCPYIKDCSIPKKEERCYTLNYQRCIIHHRYRLLEPFKEKDLGIGAMCIEDIGRLEKGVSQKS